MNNTLKHRSISRQLATEIAAGKHQATGRLPSEDQLARRFEVARSTIGRALRDLQQQGLIVRRAGSGTYVRREAARAETVLDGMPQLGLIVPNLHRVRIFEPICGEIANLAYAHDYGLWWGKNPYPDRKAELTVEEAEALCERFIERHVAGVFFVPFGRPAEWEAANQSITERLRQAGIPVVLLDRDIGLFPQRSALDLIGVDNYAGGYAMAEHLLRLGVRQLACVTRPLAAPTVDARFAGARAALLDHGLDVPQPFVLRGDPADVKFVRGLAHARQPEAILCSGDVLAAELMQALARLGIQVPRDLRLVGFDNLALASLLTVPLTTMEQPCRDIAITAFNAMRERIADPTLPPRALLLTPRLVIRESCGAYLPGKKK